MRFIGTGEAFDPRRANTSLLYTGRLKLLIDCGYGVPHALWQTEDDPNGLDGVYLSHRHADHCFGLPALVVWMRAAGRQRPLYLIGGEGASDWIRTVLELGYEGAYDPDKCFPLDFVEVAPGMKRCLGGIELSTAVSDHGMPNHAVRLEADGQALCYSGDGAPTDATMSLYTGASVLVHECYGSVPEGSGHANAAQLLEMAHYASVRTLCLVHLERGPAARDAIVDLIRRRASEHNVLVPVAGDGIDI